MSTISGTLLLQFVDSTASGMVLFAPGLAVVPVQARAAGRELAGRREK